VAGKDEQRAWFSTVISHTFPRFSAKLLEAAKASQKLNAVELRKNVDRAKV